MDRFLVILGMGFVTLLNVGGMTPGAFAGTVDVSGSTLTFTASSGEANILDIYRLSTDEPGEVRVVDYSHPSFGGTGGCAVISGTATAVCDASSVKNINISLGNKNDTLRFANSEYGTSTFFNDMPDVAKVYIAGGSGDDDINVPRHATTIDGGDGADKISASGANANAVLTGGLGADSIALTTAESPSVSGGSGRDSISASVTGGTVDGGDDGDTIFADSSDGTSVSGADGDDLITATGSDGDSNEIYGGAGTDNIQGGGEADTIDGGGDNDTLNGGDGSDSIYGDDGNDFLNGNGGVDFLYGGDGDDRLSGEEGNDYLDGGFNSLYEDGADVLTGGDDADIVAYTNRGTALSLSLNGKADDGQSDETDDIESVETIVGGTNDDKINVNDGSSETVYCGFGDDTVTVDGTADESADKLMADCEHAKYPDGITPDPGTGVSPGSGSNSGSGTTHVITVPHPDVVLNHGSTDVTTGGDGSISIASNGVGSTDAAAQSGGLDGTATSASSPSSVVSTPTAAASSSARLSVISKKLVRRKGYVKVSLKCTTAVASFCKGQIKLNRGKKRLGSRSFKITSNKTVSLRVKVSRTALTASRHKSGSRITVSGWATVGSVRATATRRVVLRLAK